jgi:Ribbon-helix-helix domain
MIGSVKGKQVQICTYFSPDVAQQMKRLCEVTRVPLAVYMREAVDDLLKKYAATLRKAGK